MAIAGQPIEAVLTLNASNFHTQLGEATKGVTAFVNSISRSTGQISGFRTAVDGLLTTLSTTNVEFGKFEAQAKGVESFNKFANGVKALATSVEILGRESKESTIGLERVREIVTSLEGTFGTAKIEVTGVANALRELNNVERQTAQSTQRVATATKQYGANQTNVKMAIASASESLSMYHQHLRSLAMGIEQFNAFEKSAISTTRQVSTATYSASESLAMYHQHLKALALGVEKFNAIETGHTKVEREVATATNQVTNATNRATSSIQRQAVANRTATASTNQLTSATSRLGRAMSSLRMMGSLVGSMLAYNFAHKLLIATGETIHAKSEMEGYFKMLNFGQRDINSFNKALDKTVAQFQRVNKYSLGETISSIGVEFDLSTKEMEKAMKVTSMVTSEYLRAGRNANEASLAVKDVLQGQFQRLSRETGVKGEQLKDAGWSGDTKDVLGLMEALEKVGKSRNWDVFAEKANSLNDILTITQNRFGEWSADLVYSVQPSIIGFFNMVMGTAQKFASVMGATWDWLNSDDILAQITKWTGLATAITGVASAFVVYRTGANLVQVAQMGLTRTIASTVLGLQAEQVAESGLTATIFSRITGLKAEQVATMGVQRSIMTKVLGLNAEKVATMGLKGAIGEEVLARRIQEATMKGASAQHMAMIYTEYQEQMAKRGTLATIMAKVLGLDMEIFAEEGLFVAVQKRMAQSGSHIIALIGEKMATMGTAEATLFLVATLGSLLAIVGLVVVAIGSWAIALKNSADEMKRFNEIVDHGADTVKENRKTLETYTKRQKSLQDTLAKTTEGTQKYYDTQAKLRAVNQDIMTTTRNIENSYKALQIATSSQNHYDEARTDMVIHQQERIAQAYMKAGFSAEESYEMANESIRDAEAGAEQLRLALQKLQSASDFSSKKIEEFTKQFEDAGIKDKDTIKKYTQDYLSARDIYQQGLEKSLTDDSFFGRLDGYLGMMEGSIKFTLKEWEIDWQTGNADELWKDFWNSAGSKVGGLGALNTIAQWLGIDELWKGHGITEILSKINFANAVTSWLKSEVPKIAQFFDGKTLMDLLGLDPNTDYIGDFFNWISESLQNGIKGFLDLFSGDSFSGMHKIDIMSILKGLLSLGDSIDFSWASEYVQNNIITPLTTAWNNFMADPLSYIGGFVMGTGLGGLITALMGGEVVDYSWVWEYLNNNIIIPLQTQWNMFLADPLSYIGGVVTTGLGGLLNALMPNDGGVSILNWVNTSIIQPMTLGIQTGIASIPILGDIAMMLGLIPQANPDAHNKGVGLMQSLGTAITNTIASIPILSDILRMLGIIPQANPTASSNGRGVGDAIKTGFKNGLTGIVDIIKNELDHIVNAIRNKIDEAKNSAIDLGNAVVNGVKSAIDPGSPGIIARSIIGNEFGTYIPQKIADGMDLAYSTAQSYGQSIKDGISSVNLNSFGSFATDYEADTQMINTSTELMGIDTTTAFNNMSTAVNSTTNTMGSNVISTYTSMQTKQASSLNTMKQQNLSAYNDMYLKSNQSLVHMRDSTSNVTHQMTNAWNTMKNNIVESANRLKHDSTVHFNTLSNTIGGFYRKIQNPSSWGGSPHGGSTHRNVSAGRRIASSFTGGRKYSGGRGSTYDGRNTMTIAQLKKKICPSGDCNGIFDGWSATDVVDVRTFLSMVDEGGFGSWSDWHNTHYNHIKNKSDAWSMKSPTIQLKGGIPTNADYKVGDFESGSPKISFASFQSMAESIFSAIPYRFYYNSDWKGSWLGALQAGACNCWDGAHAILAFAQSCGFGGSIAHGSWVDPDGTTYPHVWAVINGKKMDTTGWQQRGSWSAGSPNARIGNATRVRTNDNNTQPSINVTVNINEPVYGVDDLDSKIADGVDKGLSKHFNKSYAIGV